MTIDIEYVIEQLQYAIDNAEAEGVKVYPEHTFEIYPEIDSKELVVVLVADFIQDLRIENAI